MREFQEAYPTLPTIQLRRVVVREGLWLVEGVNDYGEGRVFTVVVIFETRDGKMWRDRRYYAEPFEAPEWRAQWVERLERQYLMRIAPYSSVPKSFCLGLKLVRTPRAGRGLWFRSRFSFGQPLEHQMDHDDAPHSILILSHYEQVRKGCGFVLTRTLPEQAFSQSGI
jgi:hypothetical protein